MDFALILFYLLILTGLPWLWDLLFLAPARRRRLAVLRSGGVGDPAQLAQAEKEPVLIEYAKSFFPIILIVFALRSFVVEPFRIPSGSMLPSLMINDFILVNKFNYGIRLPVINKKLFDVGTPQRGDVMVFKFPRDPSLNYIKLVVGLPGDRIVYENKRVFINGEPAVQKPNGMDGGLEVRGERLGDIEHSIYIDPMRGAGGRHAFTVPEGQYFVLGDNRDRSNDSRFWGMVPDELIVGRAFLVWLSLADLGRIGNRIGGRHVDEGA